MSRLMTVTWGPDQFRVGPWHVDPEIAYVALSPRVATPTVRGVTRMADGLAAQGFRAVITAALRDHESAAFRTAGFHQRERLVVLSHDLADLPVAPEHRHRRFLRRDRASVLALDQLAFEPSWRLDVQGLRDAVHATPRARFRVVDEDGAIAYSICGRSGRVGYVQRLAVHPEHRARGLARALVLDALRWLRRKDGTLALVNTQESNDAALALYAGLGFEKEPTGLSVWFRELGR